MVYGSYHNDTIADIQRRTMSKLYYLKYTQDTDPSEVDASIEAVINKLKLITDRGI